MAISTEEESNMEGSLQETFDWIADRYLIQTHQVSRGHYRQWMDQVSHLVQAWHPDSVVDVGCGPGYLLSQLKTLLPDCDLTGVDYSARMLDHVSPRIVTHHQSWRAWVKASTEQFDVMIMTFVLRDQVDALDTVKQLADRLKPKGHLIILETHTPEGIRGLGFNLYFHHIVPWWGEAQLTRDWPKEHGDSPYRLLSASHRRWMRDRPLPQVLSQAGYRQITQHTSSSDVVALWTAQPGRISVKA